MQPLPAASCRVLDAVTANLEVGDSRKIDRSSGVYMALHVERLTEKQFSLAHYFQQNGDLVCDPDGVFLKTDSGWLPISLQLCNGHYTRALEMLDDKAVRFSPKALKELTSFARMWLKNIASQQGGTARILRTAPTTD